MAIIVAVIKGVPVSTTTKKNNPLHSFVLFCLFTKKNEFTCKKKFEIFFKY